MGGHDHHHIDPESGDRKVVWALLINFALTLAQIAGGILSGSLALIADAIHNLSDAMSLAIAFLARRVARRPADGDMTFGYGRIEMVAALINYTTLIIIGLYLIYQAAWRFLEPSEIDGWLVVVIAAVALLVDLATAALTFRLSRQSVNIRAAFLHNLADALGSVAVILAGTLILLYDWRLIDPIVTLLIAGYILWMSFSEIGGVIRMLMLSSPAGLKVEDLVERVNSVEGVAGVHHVHLWQMQEHQPAFDAHLEIDKGAWNRADGIKARVRALLKAEFGIGHSTLETECANHLCDERSIIRDE